MLWIDNTINATDPVFGLLVDSGASVGKGFISDVTCLQMAVADVAFTNAKKFSDLDGMVASLIYRTLERNTNGVGIKSSLCTSMRSVNPEIAALEQHQDPASDGAANHNRAVVLELARQISLIGGNISLATEAGTFAPGTPGDPTGKGNSCDDANCIYNGRLQVLVTHDEILSYVSQCVATLTLSITQTKFTATQTTGSSVAASTTRTTPPTPSQGMLLSPPTLLNPNPTPTPVH